MRKDHFSFVDFKLPSVHSFNYSSDYTLENERVKITPLQEEHIEKLLPIAREESIWTYFLEDGLGDEKFRNYCLEALTSRAQKKEYPFVLFSKIHQCYFGMTRLYDYHENLGVIKMGHTWLGKDFWGTKLNKHSKFLLFEFIFDTLNLERIGFGVHGENLRSVMALISIGCQQEGVLRSFLPNLSNTNRTDLLLFSLLKEDWKDGVRHRLMKKLEEYS